MKTLLMLVFLAVSHIGVAQLTDPFGKIIVHEIKLNKQKDGTYVGAIEWTTGGIDSLQRFIINDLSIKAPVMVRIISKAPKHNIDLSFHKENWDKKESNISISTNKFASKTFRTMGTAGLGVSSKVAGIPYLITVKVGLQFPSTKSLIRITDNKEEYAQHLRGLGYTGAVFDNDQGSNDNNSDFASRGSGDNSNLMYIIISLLAVIAILLFLFLLKKKWSKTTLLLVFCFGLVQVSMSQSTVPRNIPVSEIPEVFIRYKTGNIANQAPIPIDKPNVRIVNIENPVGEEGGFITERPVRIESNPGSILLTPEDAAKLERRWREGEEQFDSDFGEGSPGENTEGDQRTLPFDRSTEELTRLRRQVQRLQQQVDYLSARDRDYESSEDEEGGVSEILRYCEQVEDCQNCMMNGYNKFVVHMAYFDFLQKYYLRKSTDLNDWIQYGNSMASIPGAGMGWGPILTHKVRPAMNELRDAYDKKFDEYINSMTADLALLRTCYTGERAAYPSSGGYEAQVSATILILKASRINK